MKKRLLAMAILCMSGVSAQSPPPVLPAQQQPDAWAEKLFGPAENLVHDFGMVPCGAQLHHDFALTNIYAVPIEIVSLRGGMGVLTARPSKRILQPNEKAIISVQMDGRRFVGHKSVTVWVQVGPTYVSTVRLGVKATCRDDMICTPGEAAFGTVTPGQTPSTTVDIEYSGNLAWQVSEVVVPKDAPFEATVKELFRRPGQIRYQVKVSLKNDAPLGPFQENILLKTNEPNAGPIPLAVNGNIQAPLKAMPSTLNLEEVKAGQKLARQVFIPSPIPFKVVGIEGLDAVRLGEPPLADQLPSVTIEITSPEQPGPFRYDVKIKTDVQDTPVVVVIQGVVSKQ